MEDNTISKIDIFQSLNKETRLCILECAVFIEQKVADTLGRILGINWNESESLGYGSASLGLDSKFRLIQDLKKVSSKTKTQLQAFMTIRNKFAHIAEIDSFTNYFTLIKSSKERKKELQDWFPNLNYNSKDVESLYKFAYLLLTIELFQALFDIDITYAYEKGEIAGRKKSQEIFIENIKFQLNKTEEGRKALEEAVIEILNKYDN